MSGINLLQSFPPRGPFVAAVQNSNDVRRAFRFAPQIHLGEKRKITGNPYFDEHVMFVTYAYADLNPTDYKGIVDCLLHDIVESAEKQVKRIAAALQMGKDRNPDFMDTLVPPVFVEFLEQYSGYNPTRDPNKQLLDQNDDVILAVLNEQLNSAGTGIEREKKLAKVMAAYTDFVRQKIFEDFGFSTEQSTYNLTRQEPEEYYHVHFLSASGVLSHVVQSFDIAQKYQNDTSRGPNDINTLQSKRYLLSLLRSGPLTDFREFVECAYGVDLERASWENVQMVLRDVKDAMTVPLPHEPNPWREDDTLLHITARFTEFMIGKNVLGYAVERDVLAFPNLPLKDILTPDNTEHIYNAFFTDDRVPLDIRIKDATKKLLDNLANVCTLDPEKPEFLKLSADTIARADRMLPVYERLGLDEDLVMLLREAVNRAHCAHFRVVGKSVTGREPEPSTQPRLRNPAKSDWILAMINRQLQPELCPVT